MSWTFFTNHAHVLFCLAETPDMRLREVAERVGITERAAQRIVTDLHEAGYLSIEREGRRNVYQVMASPTLRHPIEQHLQVGDILDVVVGESAPGVGRGRKKR